MGRKGRDYWVEQLAEYWESGLTIQEYSDLKELPYESVQRWIRTLKRIFQASPTNPNRWSWSKSRLRFRAPGIRPESGSIFWET